MAEEEWPQRDGLAMTLEKWPERGGKERRPQLTEVWVLIPGVAASGLVPATFQNSSPSEARPPSRSRSWGSCSDTLGCWRASLLRPRGPGAGSPFLACGMLRFRNSTGGGLQSLENVFTVACILGFFDDLEAGAEEGLQRRRVGCRSPWYRGWSKQLPFKLGRRMGLVVAAWSSVDGTQSCGVPSGPPPSQPLGHSDRGGGSKQGEPIDWVFHSLVAPNLRRAPPAQVRDTYLLSKEGLALPSWARPSASRWEFSPGRNNLSGEASLRKGRALERRALGPWVPGKELPSSSSTPRTQHVLHEHQVAKVKEAPSDLSFQGRDVQVYRHQHLQNLYEMKTSTAQTEGHILKRYPGTSLMAPVVKTLCFQSRGCGFDPWLGN